MSLQKYTPTQPTPGPYSQLEQALNTYERTIRQTQHIERIYCIDLPERFKVLPAHVDHYPGFCWPVLACDNAESQIRMESAKRDLNEAWKCLCRELLRQVQKFLFGSACLYLVCRCMATLPAELEAMIMRFWDLPEGQKEYVSFHTRLSLSTHSQVQWPGHSPLLATKETH